MLAQSVRSQKERTLFVVSLIVSGLVWLGIVVTLVGLLYAPFVALAVVVGHALFLARITGHSIRVGSRQLPELYKKVENAASKLGLERMPEVYVTTGGGILNAFATKLFSRNFVILNAEILDACEQLDADKGPNPSSSADEAPGFVAASEGRAVDFIIGHELGHLALGHLNMNWLLWPAKIMPLLGPAYSRACEYSCDACGLAVVDDVETASRALAVLSAGGRQAKKVNLDALIEQRHETGSLVMALVELNSSHPYLSKRVAALHRLKNAALAPDVGRNPLSYVMAPFFGFAAGGGAALFTMYMYVAVIGIMAAVAIPAFQKYEARSRELAGPVGIVGTVDDNMDADAPVPSPELEKLLADLQAQAAREQAGNGGAIGGLGLAAAIPQQVEDLDEDDQAVEEEELPSPKFEARAWLKGQLAAKNKEAVAGLATPKAAALVDKIYKSGATQAWVTGVSVDDDGVFAANIVAELPEKPAARRKLFDLCTAEYKKQGYDDACEDDGANRLWFTFD